MGRPSKLTDAITEQVAKIAKLGATEREIAEIIGVDAATIWRWKEASEPFRNALKLGKSEPDDRVERSLFWRAVGYSHDDVDIRVVNGEVVITPIVKHYPPDTVACIFWLKNRRKEEWRQNPDDGGGGADGAKVLDKLASRLPD